VTLWLIFNQFIEYYVRLSSDYLTLTNYNFVYFCIVCLFAIAVMRILLVLLFLSESAYSLLTLVAKYQGTENESRIISSIYCLAPLTSTLFNFSVRETFPYCVEFTSSHTIFVEILTEFTLTCTLVIER